jgi:hypothetical protein
VGPRTDFHAVARMKESLPLPYQGWNISSPARSLVTVLTELTQLLVAAIHRTEVRESTAILYTSAGLSL